MDAVELYKKRLAGETKQFPMGFWVGEETKENAKKITIFFIEEVLKWDDDTVKKNMTEKVFRKHKLSGMLEYVFKRSPYAAINNAYPGKYKEWDFKAAPRHIWEIEEKRNEAIRDLLIKVNKDKVEELTNLDFLNNGLGGLMCYLVRKKIIFDNAKNIENGLNSKERILKVAFNKAGGTSIRNNKSTRIALPVSWLRELGVSESELDVVASFDGEKIIIQKYIK